MGKVFGLFCSFDHVFFACGVVKVDPLGFVIGKLSSAGDTVSLPPLHLLVNTLFAKKMSAWQNHLLGFVLTARTVHLLLQQLNLVLQILIFLLETTHAVPHRHPSLCFLELT